MNWTLILELSLFGLAMGVATVFVIPSSIEPAFWLVIFVICAFMIARRSAGRYFQHGVFVSLLNSVWITTAHLVFFDRYITNHRQEAAMMTSMPLPNSPRTMMAIMGPVIGLVSGVVLGLFSVAAHKIMSRPTGPRG